MAKFLWACWDGGGNLRPSLGIARALRERGHSIVFAGRADMIGRVRADGFPTRELTQAYALIDRYAPFQQVRIFGYLSSPAVGDELATIVVEEAPDALVIDAMFSAALDVAPRTGLPCCVMLHTFLRRMLPAWRGNMQMQSEIRERAGFPPLASLDALWGDRDLVHVNTLSVFDGNPPDPWRNVRHGAPILAQEQRAIVPELPWQAPLPLVLVSFSTVEVQRSPMMLQRAIDALSVLPVHVVVTTGGIVDPRELTAPANAIILPFASHEALMPGAALVLTHGGHGTAMRSLRHGVPMVLTPALAGDQPFVCAAVDEWGAGRVLPREPEIADIRAAVQAVLAEPAYRANARRQSARLAETDGAMTAANALEVLSSGPGAISRQAPKLRDPLVASAS
jgi:UDP:flavonoid glycosyltransferase YjiC (YdhE family)